MNKVDPRCPQGADRLLVFLARVQPGRGTAPWERSLWKHRALLTAARAEEAQVQSPVCRGPGSTHCVQEETGLRLLTSFQNGSKAAFHFLPIH